VKFSETIEQASDLLQRKGRLSYRTLKLEFDLSDEQLDALKEELIEVQELAVDKDGKMLVWVGAAPVLSSEFQVPSSTQHPAPNTQHPEAERRQLTVMFCDLVGSTALSAQLDPEDLREVVRAYQQICGEVIQRYDGHIAQYLGDGILVYFGYPVAHEDDARRAVRAGLEIIQALQTAEGSNPRLPLGQHDVLEDVAARRMTVGRSFKAGLQVRLGIHTGLVVIGDIGASGRTEQLALGETPNIAARIQGLAEPNTVIVSTATQRLIEGQFECQPFGSHLLKGIDTPIAVYHVQSERQTIGQLEHKMTLTPLVGRDQEMGLLLDRWEQVTEGRGQVVLLSGEPGIGKSRLAHTLKEHVTAAGSLLFEARCSPYHQQSALYPLIEMMQRTLLFTRQDTDDGKIAKLERALALYDMQEFLPLLTALLSLPMPSQYPPLTFTPQRQKERTLHALLQILMAQAERQATVSVWEDLHWADPSSLEFLSLLIEQLPTTKLLLVLTFRPEFTPPWKPRSHLTPIVLNRLGKNHVEAMIEQAAAGKDLPSEVIEQIRIKTDGVPLFVEELTKSVLEFVESLGSVGATGRSPLQLAIPATLQEALLARLDRLSTARQVAQLGATLGREFSYELLRAISPLEETDLQTALAKLVEAEILYQRGVGEQTRYFFKHALIQDMAYQSLLKSTRQQYHQQIAQVLQEQFPATTETQPELLAHHYSEAGLREQAIPYWQQAGQRAVQRSANVEAITHFTKGLELLKTLPDTPERAQQELTLQIALGRSLMLTRGFTAPEVRAVLSRTLELCQQIGETPQLIPALWFAWGFYIFRAEWQTARELGERLIFLAQRTHDSAALLGAHRGLAEALYFSGNLGSSRTHFEHALALYDPQQCRSLIASLGSDMGVNSLIFLAHVLWLLGYPDQARMRSRAALTLVQEIAHPQTTALVWGWDIVVNFDLREIQSVQQRAEAEISLCKEQGFLSHAGWGILWRTWALVMQEQAKDGTKYIQAHLAASRAAGLEALRPYVLALLAEAYGKTGQVEEGLTALAEALVAAEKTGERWYEAELYRLKGELTLQQSRASLGQVQDKSPASHNKSEVSNPQHPTPSTQAEADAEACFQKAIDIAQKQQAKSWELRASTSLARLWQQQGKKHEARNILSEIYNWFTEGFDTKDLQEAKTLLEELA
jgi:class 3 adenylate cyclase/predicted ATPase